MEEKNALKSSPLVPINKGKQGEKTSTGLIKPWKTRDKRMTRQWQSSQVASNKVSKKTNPKSQTGSQQQKRKKYVLTATWEGIFLLKLLINPSNSINSEEKILHVLYQAKQWQEWWRHEISREKARRLRANEKAVSKDIMHSKWRKQHLYDWQMCIRKRNTVHVYTANENTVNKEVKTNNPLTVKRINSESKTQVSP